MIMFIYVGVPFASYLQPLFSFLLPLITEENMYLCTATISTLSSVIYTQCLSLDEVMCTSCDCHVIVRWSVFVLIGWTMCW